MVDASACGCSAAQVAVVVPADDVVVAAVLGWWVARMVVRRAGRVGA